MAMEANDIDALDAQLDALETGLSSAGSLVAQFDGELRRLGTGMAQASSSVGSLSTSISGGLRRAFDGLVFDGMKASDAMKSVARSIVDATYSAALKPVKDQVGGLFGGGIASLIGGAFARGGTFVDGHVRPFAKGGIVSAPTFFPMRDGAGLMGEAGPEAIMPLTRGADGRLGVRAEGGGERPVQVVMNISTPDVAGFQKSRSQIAAQMGRALARGQRNR